MKKRAQISLPSKVKRGRPNFKPTDGQRQRVKLLTAFGTTQDEVCLMMGLTKPTLHKYFRLELDVAMAEANSLVASTAFKLATSGNCVTATMFWMRTRGGWTDKQALEISGAGGGPVQSITTTTTDPIEAARIYQKMMSGE